MTEQCESERPDHTEHTDQAVQLPNLWVMTALGSHFRVPAGHLIASNIDPIVVGHRTLWVVQLVYLHGGRWPTTFTIGAIEDHGAALRAMSELYESSELTLLGRDEWFEPTRDYLLAYPTHHVTRRSQ